MEEFKKVSFEQYCKDCGYTEQFGHDLIDGFKQEYDDIIIPKRATKGSAGYDFFLPFRIDLEPNETIVIPTGIRWVVDQDLGKRLVLYIYPKSGLGFKYQLNLANTVGIIDNDFYKSDNEGDIQIKLVNRGLDVIRLDKGKGFVQGIVSTFVAEDNVTGVRNGGFNSTDGESMI